MPDTQNTFSLCELRFDIPLAPLKSGQSDEARRFERAWRAELTAQKMTAVAMPPARAVKVRFRIVGPDARPALGRYLQARMGALPGSPAVTLEPEAFQPDWTGVQIWLSYSAADLPTLLRTPKMKENAKTNSKRLNRSRGHRP